ncbi:MAG: hypothetical protein L0Y55_04910, partial [Anaerolineales bacterium]|nr:hypothetical protein [Anaerolineales bacterium]
ILPTMIWKITANKWTNDANKGTDALSRQRCYSVGFSRKKQTIRVYPRLSASDRFWLRLEAAL